MSSICMFYMKKYLRKYTVETNEEKKQREDNKREINYIHVPLKSGHFSPWKITIKSLVDY